MNLIGNTVKDFTLPPRGKLLLKQLSSCEITTKQFDLSCAEWMLENINDYVKHPEPAMPEDLKDYFRKRKEDYKFNINPEFFKQPHIVAYMTSSSAISTENKKNRFWLEYMRNVIPEENIEAHKKIREKLNTFGIYDDRSYIPPEVSMAQEIFGTGNACPKDKSDPESKEWNF